MDGLLIDSEPLWFEAATEIMQSYGIVLSQEEYNTSTGLRTKEFLHYWFNYFKKETSNLTEIEKNITELVISKVITKGESMKGVNHAIEVVQSLGFKIGLASSSPIKLIDTVVEKLNLQNIFSIITSAEKLPYGKPHPAVFLECAEGLQSHPIECVCIEDSFNGMIAAKASRMKCVIVPDPPQFDDNKWYAADIKLNTLSQLNSQHFMTLNK